jgi:hypothetical protein
MIGSIVQVSPYNFFLSKKNSLIIKKGTVLYEEVDEVYTMYLCEYFEGMSVGVCFDKWCYE